MNFTSFMVSKVAQRRYDGMIAAAATSVVAIRRQCRQITPRH